MTQNEILILLVGAGISLVGSISFALISKISNHIGRLRIFSKIVFSKTGEPSCMQIINNSGEKVFQIPLWIEIVNTKNVPMLLRDVSMHIFFNDEEKSAMTQINYYKSTSGNQIESKYYGDDGNYSFVIPPFSTRKYDLHFMIKANQCNGVLFDNVKLLYFDARNRRHIIHFHDYKNGWDSTECIKDAKWRELR